MIIADWLMIHAVLLGLVIAIRVNRYLDETKEIPGRRLWVLKTLTATPCILRLTAAG